MQFGPPAFAVGWGGGGGGVEAYPNFMHCEKLRMLNLGHLIGQYGKTAGTNCICNSLTCASSVFRCTTQTALAKIRDCECRKAWMKHGICGQLGRPPCLCSLTRGSPSAWAPPVLHPLWCPRCNSSRCVLCALSLRGFPGSSSFQFNYPLEKYFSGSPPPYLLMPSIGL